MQAVHALPERGVQVAAQVGGHAVLQQHPQQRLLLLLFLVLLLCAQERASPGLGVGLRDDRDGVVRIHHQHWRAAPAPAEYKLLLYWRIFICL